MLLRFKSTDNDILYNNGYHAHSKVYSDVKTYTFRVPYRSEHKDTVSYKWSVPYTYAFGDQPLIFRIGYIYNYEEKSKRYRFRAPYVVTIPQQKRYLFKAPYKVQNASPIESFYMWSIPYMVSIGKSKKTYTFKAPYVINTVGSTPVRLRFPIRYMYSTATEKQYQFSMPYMNYQVKNPNMEVKFSMPYINTVSANAMNYLDTELNQEGEEIKVRKTLPIRAENHNGDPVVVIPMFTKPLISDEYGEKRDFKFFITYPPKYINYSTSGVMALDEAYYSKLAIDMQASPDDYKYEWKTAGERSIGKGITSKVIFNPKATELYSKYDSPIVELRIYGLKTTIDISTEEGLNRFLKSIPGISLSTYTENGDSKDVFVENSDIYVNSDVNGFDNPFANLYFRNRDIRDDTINYNFQKHVSADSQLYRIKIKEVKNCCLDKEIDLSENLFACKLPKATINISITSKTEEQILRLNPLQGFLRFTTVGQTTYTPPTTGGDVQPPTDNSGASGTNSGTGTGGASGSGTGTGNNTGTTPTTPDTDPPRGDPSKIR